MAARVRIELGPRSYFVQIGHGILAGLGAAVREALPGAPRALVITDSGVGPAWSDRAVASLEAAGVAAAAAVVPGGERCKTLQVAESMYEKALDHRLDRASAIVGLGGGAVTDLAGFVAATFLRGIPYVSATTTLLGMVDASVGGKVAVNLARGKNLVGAFHQPAAVLADLGTLVTLPDREYRSGLAEVVKHGLIRDRGLFELLEQQADPVLRQDQAVLTDVVERNVRIKGAVVSADEREGGLRAILNLGHTIGHGLEAVQGRVEGKGAGDLLHGECVAVGLVGAARLAAKAGVLAQPDLPDRLAALLQRLGLPVSFPPGTDPAAVQAAMQFDKKAAGGALTWVLPVRVGQVQVTRHVQPDEVAAILQELAG